MLFLSAYFPIALICFFRFRAQYPAGAIATLAVGLTCLSVLYLYVFAIAPHLAPLPVKVTSHRGRDGDVMGYVAAYVVPFVAVPFGDWQQGIALLVFLGVLGLVYVRSNMVYINPMLNLVGFHLYEVDLETSEYPCVLITRRRVKRGDMLQVVSLDDGIVLERKDARHAHHAH